MNCAICHLEIENDQRVTANVKETFVFKPAHIPDPEVFVKKNGVDVKVNLAATQSPEYMREIRKDHLRTEIAKVWATYGKDELPDGAFRVRHAACEVQKTGGGASPSHPLAKHTIRYTRSMGKRAF